MPKQRFSFKVLTAFQSTSSRLEIPFLPVFFFLLVFTFLISWALMFPTWAAQTVRIGILYQGTYEAEAELIPALRQELEALNQGQYTIIYPEEATLNGEYDLGTIRSQAQELVTQHNLNAILAYGTEASKVFAAMDPLPVPVIGLSLDFPIGLGMLDGKTLKPGNPNWTTSFDPSIGNSVIRFVPQVLPLTRLTYLCVTFLCDNNKQDANNSDAVILPNAQDIKVVLETFGRLGGLPIEVVNISPQNYPEQIAQLDAEVVFMPRLHEFTQAQAQDVFKRLADRKIPSFTQEGEYGVRNGALVSINDPDFRNIARNYALKLFDILNGIPPEEISVLDSWQIEVIFNQDTARKINYDIPLEFVYEARMIGAEAPKRPLSLPEAFYLALKNNHAIQLKTHSKEQAVAQTRLVERGYYPQVTSKLNHARTDNTRADLQPSPRNQTTVELEFGQSLYNRELNKSVESSELGEDVAEKDLEQTRQDLMQQVSQVYLNHLLAQEIVDIRRTDLKTYRKLRDVAQLRYDLEESSKSDVLRVEIQLENARVEMVNATESLFQAQVVLNSALDLAEETELHLDPRDFTSEIFDAEQSVFGRYFRTSRGLQIVRDFVATNALQDSIELQKLDASIAQVRAERERVRSKFWPTIRVGASWFQQIQDEHRDFETQQLPPDLGGATLIDEEKNYEDSFRTGWNAQISLIYPLYNGGSRYKEIEVIDTQLLQLITQREQLKDQLTEQARLAHFQLYSSRNTAIGALKSLELATESLRLGEIAYLQGSLPIIDLLDIQSNRIQAEIQATVARYQYFQGLATVFRVMNRIHLFPKRLDAAVLIEFETALESYFENQLQQLQKLQQ